MTEIPLRPTNILILSNHPSHECAARISYSGHAPGIVGNRNLLRLRFEYKRSFGTGSAELISSNEEDEDDDDGGFKLVPQEVNH